MQTALVTLTIDDKHLSFSPLLEAGELSVAQAKLVERISNRSQEFMHRSDKDLELMDICYARNEPQVTVCKKDVAAFVKRLRRRLERLQAGGPVWVVSNTEYGDLSGRPHAHLIIAAPEGERLWMYLEQQVKAAWTDGHADVSIGRTGAHGKLEGYLLKDFMKNRVVKDRYVAEGREPPSVSWPMHESIGKAAQVAVMLPMVCRMAKHYSAVEFETMLQRGFWDSLTMRTPRDSKWHSTAERDKSAKSVKMLSRAACESLREKLYDYGLRHELRTERIRDLIGAEAVLAKAAIDPGLYHVPAKAQAHAAAIEKSRRKSELVKRNHQAILRRKGKIR